MLSRVTRGGLLLALVTAAVLVAANFWVSREQSVRHMQDRLDRQLQQMASSLEIPLWSYDEQTISLICEAFLAGGDAAHIQVQAGEQGRPHRTIYTGRKPEAGVALSGQAPIRHGERTIGSVAISLSGQTEARHLRQVLLGSIISAVAIMLVVGLLVRVLVARSIAAPLRGLVGWMDQVARGHYGQAAEEVDDEELRPIAAKFSEMSRQVAAREESLRESERRFRDLADLLPGMVFETDDQGRINFLNRQGLQTLGLSPLNVEEGIHLNELPAPQDRQRVEGHLENILAGREEEHFECHCLDNVGKVFPVLAYLSPVLREDRLVGVRGVALDMSQQKELEGRLAQTSKLEAIGTLAGGIAHDFNNILGAIIGYAELSLEGGQLVDEDRQNLQEVRHAGERAKNLVRQILTFGRRDFDDPTPQDMSRLVEEAVVLTGKMLPPGVRIEREIAKGAGQALVNPTRIHQVVMNLCTNASQALPGERGVIRVTLQQEHLTGERVLTVGRLAPGPYVVLKVMDHGKGIPPEAQARIFDPFFTTKELGRGTGMGLSVVHGVVVGYEGAIEVQSELGKGTTIAVYLPRVASEELSEESAGNGTGPGPARTDLEAGAPRGRRVLFVDDEEMLTRLGNRLLVSLGFEVTTRTSGQEALEDFLTDPEAFDLVITDETMPGMTGQELVRAVLEARPGTPVIICSGNTHALDRQALLATGVREVLTKPIGRNTLEAAVLAALS